MSKINILLDIMAQLRDSEKGCPWDKAQTNETILPFTLEEVYEVAEAIDHQNMDALREELGDLLFQIVFYARIAEEAGHFSFDGIVETINQKLISRHPHVFGEEEISSAEAQTYAWEQYKEQERAANAEAKGQKASVLDNVPHTLPGLMRAEKLQRRAARVGFDWPEIAPVLDKLEEELAEFREALESESRQEIEHELGDILFACVNLARHANVNAEVAVRGVNQRFETRFRRVEELAEQKGGLETQSLDEMEQLWCQAKEEEKSGA